LHGETVVAKHSTLYVVATPIGNLRDITLRALDVLRAADVIAAEDTRVAGKLLASHGIAARVIASHQHNETESAAGIVKLLADGKSVALISDAGTPGISDPGAVVVSRAMEAGFDVVAIPGPSALAAALSVCGMSAPRMTFSGFLPARSAGRRAVLELLARDSGMQVFYEAPHRIEQTIEDLVAVFGGDRQVAIARELTKVFEEVHRCLLGDALAWLRDRPERIRGEFVLIVEGAAGDGEEDDGEAQRVLRLLLAELPLKQAVRLAAGISGQKKNQLYQSALALKASEAAD
jgi:16S rRNA (cytidine1402-2'-O)-methyltransferase